MRQKLLQDPEYYKHIWWVVKFIYATTCFANQVIWLFSGVARNDCKWQRGSHFLQFLAAEYGCWCRNVKCRSSRINIYLYVLSPWYVGYVHSFSVDIYQNSSSLTCLSRLEQWYAIILHAYVCVSPRRPYLNHELSARYSPPVHIWPGGVKHLDQELYHFGEWLTLTFKTKLNLNNKILIGNEAIKQIVHNVHIREITFFITKN